MGVLTTALIIGMVASTTMQVAGKIKEGNAAKKIGELEQEAANDAAGLTDYNAEVASLQAADAITRGTEEENRYRTGIRGIIGAQRTGFAGGNVDVGFGSAVDVSADAAFLGELDALTIQTNAAREAWGFEVEAEDLGRRADIQRKEGTAMAAAGRENQKASRYAAVATGIGGATSLLQMRYGYKK